MRYFTCVLTILVLFLLTTFINANDKTTLTNNIVGISDELETNAINRLELLEKIYKNNLNSELIRDIAQNGKKEIAKALQPYGYFSPDIKLTLQNSQNNWTANYIINKNEPVRITKININILGSGKNNERLLQTKEYSQKQINRIFTAKRYNKIKNTLLTRAQNQGYINAKFLADRVIIKTSTHECIINLIISTNGRFYFGAIRFSHSPFTNKFLRRYLTYHENIPFSYRKILSSQEALTGSQYFSSATIVYNDKKLKNKKIPTKIHLTMLKATQYKFGLGYSSADGPRVTVGYTRRWINRWGHRFSALFSLSPKEKDFFASYIIPGSRPSHDQYAINMGIYKIKPPNGESLVQKIGASYTFNKKKWQTAFNIDYDKERYRFDDDAEYQSSNLLVPSATLTLIDTNKIVNVKNGNKFSINVQGALIDFFSSVSYLQTDIQYKTIRTFWQKNRLVLFGNIGYTKVNDLDKLPLSKQFYLGGIGNMRGYAYRDLGPGKYKLMGSVEYQREVIKSWYGAVFYDIGNAMNNYNDHLARSVGIGTIWQSPIGALKIYISHPIDRTKNLQFEISLGPDL